MKFLLTLILISGISTAWSQPSDWQVKPADFANSMTFAWQVTLSGDESVTAQDQMAAFAGGECRGIVTAIELDGTDECATTHIQVLFQ